MHNITFQVQYAFFGCHGSYCFPFPPFVSQHLTFSICGFSGLLGVSKIKRKDEYDEQRAGRQQNRERGCVSFCLHSQHLHDGRIDAGVFHPFKVT